jgi:outer membrane lipoprotein-sorting protein
MPPQLAARDHRNLVERQFSQPNLQGPDMKRGVSFFLIAFLVVAANGCLAQKASPTDKKTLTPTAEAPKAAAEPLDPQLVIKMADDYFNAAQVMTADFVQVGVDGRRSEGKLYVAKPGRLRFEYAQPATMEIIADGTTVAIRDRKLQTQQLYFISQTPLKFLLKEDLNLKRDVKVVDVTSDPHSTTITVEDGSTFGGTSRIKLNFDSKTFSLKLWEVTDPQGYQTLVTLHNIDLKSIPDRNLFRIPSDSIWPTQN